MLAHGKAGFGIRTVHTARVGGESRRSACHSPVRRSPGLSQQGARGAALSTISGKNDLLWTGWRVGGGGSCRNLGSKHRPGGIPPDNGPCVGSSALCWGPERGRVCAPKPCCTLGPTHSLAVSAHQQPTSSPPWLRGPGEQ